MRSLVEADSSFFEGGSYLYRLVDVTPYVVGYDFCILSIAAAFLVKDGLSRGLLCGERAVMLLCWFGIILLMPPVTTMICVVLLALVVRRAVCLQKLSQHADGSSMNNVFDEPRNAPRSRPDSPFPHN